MNYDPKQHHRRSIRKERFDYTGAGGYFVTICTNNKPHLFGTVLNGRMHLNDAGRLISGIWNKLPTRFHGVELNEYTTMPNHLHGIIAIKNVGATPCGCPNMLYNLNPTSKLNHGDPASLINNHLKQLDKIIFSGKIRSM